MYDAKNVWEESRGKGVTVAVVDSGVDASHPDLVGNVLPGKDFSRPSIGAHKDKYGHGTGMASIIAGHGHGAGNRSGVMGIAPEAKILPVRAFKDDKKAMDWTWPDGVRYAVDQGAEVINLSFKDPNQSAGTKGAKAIAYALAHDVVVVAGVGNDGGTVSSTATLPGVVGVTAVDEDLKPWSEANSGEGVVLAAPGVDITSATPTTSSGYRKATGTSDATAYVSGIAALLRSKFPDLTAGQIINRMVKSADYLGNAPDKETLGYGIARPGTAMRMDIPKGPKEGPLAQAPSGTESKGSPAEGNDSSSNESAGKKKKSSSSSGLLIGVGIGVAVLIVVGVIFAVLRSRGNRGNGGGPGNGGPGGSGGGPSGFPGQQQYPNAAPGQSYPAAPGQAPQQGGPYGPQ
ncbi:S8 family serine peptidase [Streptomyces luteolus]|uniref:S8 family serine peptidase n=1 Tax=Streptomyces luteolus TaxID=3043615 RepID=A0ABT6T1I3_9ACTN|nr:S8 family serine peptidase [Streptomyces sp. B-S-A12]MDI3420762.1 S8 family serine peptidase [Streptomyces sp. B-S-A12]